MALERTVFIDNYLEELSDNIDIINSAIIILQKDENNIDEFNTLQRALHTIKGSSRMLKFQSIESISHGLEGVINGLNEGRYNISDNLVKLVFKSTDLMVKGMEVIKNTKDDKGLDTKKISTIFERVIANEPYEIVDEIEDEPEDNIEVQDSTSVRIKVEKVDQIIKSTNSLVIRPLKLKKELEKVIQLEKQLHSDFKSSGNRGDFSESFSILGSLKKDLKNEISHLERETYNIKESLLKLRMLPIDVILKPLNKMVQEISIKLGKLVDFKILGEDILVDKSLLESLKDPIIHIIRNSVDHGIEPKEKRIKAGKSQRGQIIVECSSNSGNVTISIRDDGKGINYSHLKKRARELYSDDIDKIENMTNSQLNVYLFDSGFSTKGSVTEVSGRGVGLDIVRFNIEKMKGKITLHSQENVGTEFILSLPHSIGYIDGFFIDSGDAKYLIPSNFVDKVILLQESEKHQIADRNVFRYDNKMIPLYYLSYIFNSKGRKQRDKEYVVVIDLRGETVGIIVENLIEYSSLVYKQLPKSLKKIKGIQGVVFDNNFNIVPILSIPEIIIRLKRVCNIDLKNRYSPEYKKYKKILVVDDSLSTREIEKSILVAENYSVDIAVDGIDGLNRAKKLDYNLIVTDISMPRMDGYTMVENLRKMDSYSKTPIIVVTSQFSKDINERFNKIGVDSIIIKSDFERGNLVDEVKRLI